MFFFAGPWYIPPSAHQVGGRAAPACANHNKATSFPVESNASGTGALNVESACGSRTQRLGEKSKHLLSKFAGKLRGLLPYDNAADPPNPAETQLKLKKKPRLRRRKKKENDTLPLQHCETSLQSSTSSGKKSPLQSLRRKISPPSRHDSVMSRSSVQDQLKAKEDELKAKEITLKVREDALNAKENDLKTKDEKIKELEEQLQHRSSPEDINKKRAATTSESDSDMPDRRNFAAIRAISDYDLRRLLSAFAETASGKKATIDQARVIARTGGTFHHIVFMELGPEDDTEEYVIRIPAHGTEEEWQEEDKYMLDNEAKLMLYIKHHTTIPIPEVVFWDEQVLNEINAPFIMMKKLPGKTAHSIWFDREYDHYLTADRPSAETEKKRITFLRSLAANMAQLGKLSFPKIGIPNCQHLDLDSVPEIGPAHHWFCETDASKVTTIEPFSSTKEYIMWGLNNEWDVEQIFIDLKIPEGDDSIPQARGIRKILEIIFACAALSSSKPSAEEDESFVLAHHDLDLQNILVDDEGNVTGILDWDYCMALPRCVGSAAAPKFLRRDRFPFSTLDRSPHMAWNMKRYRKIYAGALRAAGCGDAVYTTKSALYQAAVESIHGGGDAEDLIQKLLAALPGIRGHKLGVLLKALGSEAGWPAMEEFLAREIPRLFEPEELDFQESLSLPYLETAMPVGRTLGPLKRRFTT